MSKRILVVDDEPAVARLVKMSLAVEGYDVITAGSGMEALERMVESLPDLVILDIMMPGMSGYALCAELKSKPMTRHVRVMFLTARANLSDAQQGFSLGADDFIVKPFDPEELLARVKAILGPGGG